MLSNKTRNATSRRNAVPHSTGGNFISHINNRSEKQETDDRVMHMNFDENSCGQTMQQRQSTYLRLPLAIM